MAEHNQHTDDHKEQPGAKLIAAAQRMHEPVPAEEQVAAVRALLDGRTPFAPHMPGGIAPVVRWLMEDRLLWRGRAERAEMALTVQRQRTAEGRAANSPVTYGMWPQSAHDPLVVAAVKVLTDAGHTGAALYGDSASRAGSTGFYIPVRRMGKPVEVYHLINGCMSSPSDDGWFAKLAAYRDAFKAAGWEVQPFARHFSSVEAKPSRGTVSPEAGR